MSEEAANHLAGDYRLIELLSEDDVSRVWLGEQLSISRPVLVEELQRGRNDLRAEFLANARAKAAVDHPLIATVYEAVADDVHCFFVRERLHPHTLEGLMAAGGTMEPARLARVVRLLADAQLHHEDANQPTDPPSPEHIHVDGNDVVRIDNLALAGSRDPQQSANDIARLGAALRPLVADARPGTTRTLTLLAWMRGEGIDAKLDWQQVAEICTQIEQQLSQPALPATPTAAISKTRPGLPKKIAAAIAVVALFAVLATAWYLRPQPEPAAKPEIKQPEIIAVTAGNHPSPDGGEHQLPAFRISAQPVSIRQYAEFLDVLATLSKTGLERSFDHREQPASKTSHLPDAWPEQLKTPHHLPVIGVDWWDAVAYAEWKQARLPTQEEWFTASQQQSSTSPTPFSNAVQEWTSTLAADPANPLGGAKWVLISRSPNAAGPIAREWIDDRSLRQKGLGFRVVFAAPGR
jgi:hypothetical protein